MEARLFSSKQLLVFEASLPTIHSTTKLSCGEKHDFGAVKVWPKTASLTKSASILDTVVCYSQASE
jgi:hypothetical protein